MFIKLEVMVMVMVCGLWVVSDNNLFKGIF